MNNFNTNLDKAFTKALEAEGVTIENNKIDLGKVFKYTQLVDAKDILSEVVDSSTEDNANLVEQFDKLNAKDIQNILFSIIDDEYIISDWYSITDYHDYLVDTQTIIAEKTGIEFY